MKAKQLQSALRILLMLYGVDAKVKDVHLGGGLSGAMDRISLGDIGKTEEYMRWESKE